MTITQIESNIKSLINSFSKDSFIYNLLLAYGLPKSSITRLQKGNLNLSKNPNEIIWKKKLFFREVTDKDLHLTITQMLESSSHNERFIIATDYNTLLAIDTKTTDKLDIELKDLPNHYVFFLPWAGMEKAFHQDENPADVKAAEKMAKLFDQIRRDNPSNSKDFLHSLNIFLSRLLFCFFAEDTNIFKEGQFTNAIDSFSQDDGSDLNEFFDRLFEVLNTPKNKRKSLPEYLNNFPFVNGGLFREKIVSPKFTKSSRRAILNSGDQNWSAINPDIFGSMFQAVVSDDQRGNLGQHYTSVPNIMKVIKPLFLDELYEVFENGKNNPKKLIDLLSRLNKIKIFDPACGSGNFLIIAYKELRKLEIIIIQRLLELQKSANAFNPSEEQLSIVPKSQLSLAADFQVDFFSRIQLNHFYGIEIDDFAHEIAKLALWLAEHQMNIEFERILGKSNPTLPLKEAGNIVCANACRIDWENVCPKEKDDEIYILGNPPYLGTRNQKKTHKDDMTFLFNKVKNYKTLDYISAWFYKASKYIEFINGKYSFVSTNSITQGDQVIILWNLVLRINLEIAFAYSSFKWINNAKSNAGVTVIIIGIRNRNSNHKFIYKGIHREQVFNINPYIIPAGNTMISRRSFALSKLPEMIKGSIPADGGHLILSKCEVDELLANKVPQRVIKKFVGSQEYIKGIERWCLYLSDNDLVELNNHPLIQKRLLGVTEMRLKSTKKATVELASVPHKFAEDRYLKLPCLIIPVVSSERREYLPTGFSNDDSVIYASAQAIYNAKPWIFAIISSLIHLVWLRTVGGRLKTDFRYSSSLVYNTFPFPPISEQRKQELTQTTFRILEEREKQSDKTLAELYDPDKMPDGLREAHKLNDIAVERCYRSKPFESDEERLEYLFKLYEQMIEEEQENETLFAKEKKPRKRKKK